MANQSATGSTIVTASWYAADEDLGGWWSSGTDIVVPASGAGSVAITARLVGAAGWTTNSQVQIVVGGVVWDTGVAVSTTATATASCIVPAIATNVINVTMRNAGATQNMTAQVFVVKVAP